MDTSLKTKNMVHTGLFTIAFVLIAAGLAGGIFGLIAFQAAVVPECSDGIDNDGDGLIDYEYDLGCTGQNDQDEGGVASGTQQNGWTVFEPSDNTNLILVASAPGSEESDACDSFTKDYPNRKCFTETSLAAAKARMRNNQPDWILLKRGDTWVNERFGDWSLSGKTKQEKMIIGSYGSSTIRPDVKIGSGNGLNFPFGADVNHVAVLGIHFEKHDYKGTPDAKVLNNLGTGSDIHLEDLKLSIGQITFSANGGTYEDIVIRRNVIVDAYATNRNAHGIFASYVHGLLIEDNVIDHNGWRDVVGPAGQTKFNHNLYINAKNTGLVARGNIITRGSATGFQARPGGDIIRNVFYQNPNTLNYGVSILGGGPDPDPLRLPGVSGVIRENVVFENGDIGDISTPDGQQAGAGFHIANINATGLEVNGNIVAHDTSSPANSSVFWLDGGNGPQGLQNVNIHDNIVYDWRRGLWATDFAGNTISNIVVQNNAFQEMRHIGNFEGAAFIDYPDSNLDSNITFTQNTYDIIQGANIERVVNVGGMKSFDWWKANGEQTAQLQQIPYPNPSVSIASYNSSLGGQASFDAFIAQARLQSRFNWREEYTSEAVINYIRAGFGLAKLDGMNPAPAPPTPPAPPPPPEPTYIQNIFFKAVLEGRTDISQKDVTLEVYKISDNTLEIEFTQKADQTTQKLSLSPSILLEPGTYDLVISAPGYLKKKFSGQVLSEGSTINLPTLLAGDFNQDNIINSIDFSMMNLVWFGIDVLLDVNGDGIINSVDFSFLNKNWFLAGD